ncbi:YggS family pyridoxal phosphate-dependent enzyme [Glaesserella parasuis]|uniref:YggS family pyridoxal phosphate-dependent enzyme n=1 Tax=Glaesserella parasuis TaxID=738 RepID=UPI0024371FE6|nr:YggS family pyridoxal phosphate-dependent enzyme [Glaesserella parasuis]MDG6355068.1 YggS family pyridoxal phosphate-dependent enzyme [Glaesserella parasuis]MDO9673023.1 YggS family pyridoxal phosphate-dependent enzyme [Glaesserella parasuis]MDO9992937.1 YggS family pyridoxal phosphate-dependent enzyme [Glaesserella parasuis]MDP0100879.1 YggS family pyridoxal phosphate-dependent enzyme [Glaesserella parasuis]
MSISQNLATISQQIQQYCQQANRPEQSVKLLAVSKTKPISAIAEAIEAGQRAFGENYVQEGIEKIQHFAENDTLEWHFIGLLQSNKTRVVAEHFDWVQTIDRLKIAQRLSEQRPEHLPVLNVLIQINISDEASKSGISAKEMLELATQISQLPRLKLRGLMAIPKPESEPEQQKIALAQMNELFLQLQSQFEGIDTLSMGMSDDMPSAIECGSTMVRIGTAIFGVRS